MIVCLFFNFIDAAIQNFSLKTESSSSSQSSYKLFFFFWFILVYSLTKNLILYLYHGIVNSLGLLLI